MSPWQEARLHWNTRATAVDMPPGAGNRMDSQTLLGLLAGDGRTEVERLRGQAHQALSCFGQAAQPLADLCDYLAVRTK